MTDLKLLVSPTSPFVRKVRMLIIEAGKTAEVTEVPVATTPLATDPQILPANPLGKIPALMRGDAPAIYDSRVITRYLDDLWSLSMYPAGRLYETLTLEATADAIMDAAVSMTYEVRLRPAELQSRDWVEAQWGKVTRALDVLEGRWMSHLHGPMDMAQIALASALAYLDFRHDARGWREGRPQLAAWHAAFADRPSMQTTMPV